MKGKTRIKTSSRKDNAPSLTTSEPFSTLTDKILGMNHILVKMFSKQTNADFL